MTVFPAAQSHIVAIGPGTIKRPSQRRPGRAFAGRGQASVMGKFIVPSPCAKCALPGRSAEPLLYQLDQDAATDDGRGALQA
jgi:hypothetical protein